MSLKIKYNSGSNRSHVQARVISLCKLNAFDGQAIRDAYWAKCVEHSPTLIYLPS